MYFYSGCIHSESFLFVNDYTKAQIKNLKHEKVNLNFFGTVLYLIVIENICERSLNLYNIENCKARWSANMKQLSKLMFIIFFVILTGCTAQNTQIHITEQDAIEIAKTFDSDSRLTWTATLEEKKEVVINNKKKQITAWKVSTTYQFGNKLIVTIDATNGDIISLTETEPANCCGEGLRITNEQDAIKIAKEIKPNIGLTWNAVLDSNKEIEVNGELHILPIWTVSASESSGSVHVILINAVTGDVLVTE